MEPERCRRSENRGTRNSIRTENKQQLRFIFGYLVPDPRWGNPPRQFTLEESCIVYLESFRRYMHAPFSGPIVRDAYQFCEHVKHFTECRPK